MKKTYGKPVKNPVSIAAAIGIDKNLIKSVTEYGSGDIEIDFDDSVDINSNAMKNKIEKHLGLVQK